MILFLDTVEYCVNASFVSTAILNLSEKFNNLLDSRQKATANNLKYSMKDTVLSVFSVFFTQSPLFLDNSEL